jgi:hypothetical protein
MIGPIKAARITEVVLGVLLTIGAIIFAVLSRSLLSIISPLRCRCYLLSPS